MLNWYYMRIPPQNNKRISKGNNNVVYIFKYIIAGFQKLTNPYLMINNRFFYI